MRIRVLAQLIGTLISVFDACPLGRAHYRSLELVKLASLKNNRGNFDAFSTLNHDSVQDLLRLI